MKLRTTCPLFTLSCCRYLCFQCLAKDEEFQVVGNKKHEEISREEGHGYEHSLTPKTTGMTQCTQNKYIYLEAQFHKDQPDPSKLYGQKASQVSLGPELFQEEFPLWSSGNESDL